MLTRERTWSATVAALLFVVGACGSDGDQSESAGAGRSGYCTRVESLMSVLDGGGSVSDYDAALTRVVDAGPSDHEAAWTLLLTLSQEPFDYENFNPAADAFDAIWADLDATCSGADHMVIDDDGRIRRIQPD